MTTVKRKVRTGKQGGKYVVRKNKRTGKMVKVYVTKKTRSRSSRMGLNSLEKYLKKGHLLRRNRRTATGRRARFSTTKYIPGYDHNPFALRPGGVPNVKGHSAARVPFSKTQFYRPLPPNWWVPCAGGKLEF